MDKITDGYKHDGGKPRLALVPPKIIEAVGAVMTHGAEKYGEGNYRKVEPARYRDALMRHICKWLKNPHGIDEDSGLPHLWHIACNVAFLLELDKPEEADETTIKGVWINRKVCGEDIWFCSTCGTHGSPQWVCCPVCEIKMRGDEE